MAIAIERTRAGSSPTGQSADSPEEGTGRAPARTLTPDSETDPTEARIQRAQNKQPRKADEPCRFGCGRSTIDCHYYGPPCEERLRIHRSFFGTDAIERETEREDEYANDRKDYRED